MTIRKFVRRHPAVHQALWGPRKMRETWKKWRRKDADKILDRVSDIVKQPIMFHAEEFGADFFVNPRSHLLRRYLDAGCYEPRIAELYFRFIDPTRDIIDVGANIGFFTVGGARKLTSGRLLAAEPTSEAFQHLSRNVALNSVEDHVILFRGLIGAARGQGAVRSVPGREEYSSVGTIEHFAVKHEETIVETVPIATLDELVLEHKLRPSVLKVDVEGAELSVFSGASELLSSCRPVVLSEIWRDATPADHRVGAEMIRFFEELDYIVADPHDPLSKPGLHEIGEIVCIPKEKYSEGLLSR